MPRKEDLLKLLESEPNDPFLLYGLAMEHAREKEHARAVEAFDRVLGVDPGYCPAYYHQARAWIAAGRPAEARKALEKGMAAARQKGDLHAYSEMEALMEET